jgi:hypothetical protein
VRGVLPKLTPTSTTHGSLAMGKYLLAWVLGVPAFVLVIIYFVFN